MWDGFYFHISRYPKKSFHQIYQSSKRRDNPYTCTDPLIDVLPVPLVVSFHQSPLLPGETLGELEVFRILGHSLGLFQRNSTG